MTRENQGESSRDARTRPAVPEAIWGPLAIGSPLGTVGLIGLAAGQPWLIPSLGPTAYLQAEEPSKPSSRAYNTIVGHLVKLASGAVAVLLLGAFGAPAVLADKQLAAVRVGAAALSGVLTMLGLSLLTASHPPAAATMLLVALGGIDPTWRGATTVLAGAVAVATLGRGGAIPPPRDFPRPSAPVLGLVGAG